MLISSLLANALSDRYQIVKGLGGGGMGVVYLARDLKHDRLIALKVLHPELAGLLGRERFLREIRTAAGLQHPNIVPVHDSSEVESGESGTDLMWFTMPFVDGESLRERLQREGRLPLDLALQIAKEAARALGWAHHQGIIHRDIKPENILLTKDGTTLLADFGLARAIGAGADLTEAGTVLGTPAYMTAERLTPAEGTLRAQPATTAAPPRR
jgi:eukaryotic-like serine/threonine-protein kinase